MGILGRQFLLWMSLGALARPSFAGGFSDTTGGKIAEDTNQFGGVNVDEALEKKTRDVIKRFQDGRKSSAADQSSRYSQILEMHDEDFDGITDHGWAKNALEGGTEKAVLGKDGMPGGKDRDKLLLEKRINAGKCKDGWVVKDKIPCENISAAIQDRGAAHGRDDNLDEHHRVYELGEASQKAAADAGGKYAERTIEDAAGLGKETPLPPNATVTKRSKDGRVLQVSLQLADGSSKLVDIGANIDLEKSEVASLEQLKKHQIDTEWKSRRAARLAGLDRDLGGENYKQAIQEFAGIYANPNMTDEQKDQAVAQRVADKANIGWYPVCWNKNKQDVKSKDKPDCPQDYVEEDLGSIEVGVNPQLRAQVEQLYAQYKRKPPDGMQRQTNPPVKVADIVQCMGKNTWCYGPNQARAAAAQQAQQNRNGGSNSAGSSGRNRSNTDLTYKPVQGDPGNAFWDTREAIMNRLSVANEGPLDKFEQTMKTIDFNKTTDGKTQTKPYQQMMEELKVAKDRAQYIRQNYKQYQGANFDPSRMNTQKLFGRDPRRDATTLYTTPMEGPGFQPGNRGGGGFNGGPRTPANNGQSRDVGNTANMYQR